MLRDYEMKSSCHMIEEGQCFLYPLHLVTCKSVLFFMTFYATKVMGIYLLLASQGYKSPCHLLNTVDESM